jgi:hypothetical protein
MPGRGRFGHVVAEDHEGRMRVGVIAVGEADGEDVVIAAMSRAYPGWTPLRVLFFRGGEAPPLATYAAAFEAATGRTAVPITAAEASS